jgi:hypothetical protein
MVRAAVTVLALSAMTLPTRADALRPPEAHAKEDLAHVATGDYMGENGFLPVRTGSGRAHGPRPLFGARYNLGIESGRCYDVDPKTGRFSSLCLPRALRLPGVVRVVLNRSRAERAEMRMAPGTSFFDVR